MRATAVIAAAGRGNRMGGAGSKVYLPLHGRAMLLHTLDRFAAARRIADVIVVVAAADLDGCRALIQADPQLRTSEYRLQAGGASRQESVRLGLQRLPAECDIVVIHDGARPLVSPALIDRCVDEAWQKEAVAAGVPVRDTIKQVSPAGTVRSTLDRSALWEIQTPQAFRRQIIVEAHEAARRDHAVATDDAGLVERLGKPVYVLDGERWNIKMTVAEDLLLAEALMRAGRLPWLSEQGSS